MRKQFLVMAAAALMTLTLAGTAFAAAYVNGIDANYPPFAYMDEKTGQPAGFDVDSLNWIAKNMGFEPDGMSQEQMQEMTRAFNLPK